MRTIVRPAISAARPAGADWAEQLAWRLHAQEPASQTPAASQALEALAGLWQLFETALAQANDALERAGLRERISMQCTGNERRYVLETPDDAPRVISVLVNMPVVDAQIFGGVYIGTSQTRQPIFVVPAMGPDGMQWQVAAQDAEFSEDLVHDLFLSVFSDDPMATSRLSPLSGFDAFETPWS